MKKILIYLIFLIVCTNNSFCHNIEFPDTLSMQKILNSPVIIKQKTDGGSCLAVDSNYLFYNDRFLDAIGYREAYQSKTDDKYKERINRINYFLNRYNDSVQVGKSYIANKILADQRQQKSNDSIKLLEKQKVEIQKKEKADSVQNAQDELMKGFIGPLFIVKNIGAFTRKSVDELFGSNYITHRGGVDYYDMNKYTLGLSFTDNNYCYKMSFRLFGEEARKYMDLLLDNGNGFKFVKKYETSNLELEGDLSSQLLNGELSVYRYKDIICEILDGSNMAFTFYRTK